MRGQYGIQDGLVWLVVVVATASLLTGVSGGCHRRRQDPGPIIHPMGDAGLPSHEEPSCAWLPYSDGLSGGAVHVLMQDPRVGGRLWAATGSFVHRSEDSGQSWVQIAETPYGVRGFAFPAASPSTVIAATGRGLIKSEDTGLSWAKYTLDGLDLQRVHAHPSDGRLLFASGPRLGILRSLDSGETWSGVNDGVPWASVSDFSGDPRNPVVTVAGLSTYRALGGAADPRRGVIVRTVDGGRSWDTVFEGRPITSVSRCRANPDILWAGGLDGALLSSDGGESWTLSAAFGPGLNTIAVGGEDCSQVIGFVDAGGSVTSSAAGVHVSLDGGANWNGPQNEGLPSSSRPMASGAVVFTQPNVMLVHGGKGVHRSVDLAQTWQTVSGIGRLPFRFLQGSEAWPGAMWLGTWGNGVWRRTSSEVPWEQVDFDDLSDDYIFSITPRASDPEAAWVGGWSDFWQSNGSGFVKSGFRNTNVYGALADSDDELQMVVTQTRGILATADQGQTWVSANDGLSPWSTLNGFFIDVRTVVRDDTTGQTLIGTEGRGLFELDEHDIWQPVSSAEIQNSEVRRLIHTARHTVALMAGRGVASSLRGETSFTAINAGLSDISLADIVYEPTSQQLFGVNRDGIFVRALNDAFATWQPFGGDCVPGVPGLLGIVSDGEGAWLVTTTSKNRIYRHRVQ